MKSTIDKKIERHIPSPIEKNINKWVLYNYNVPQITYDKLRNIYIIK